MNCIFCKADSTASRSVEHIIPESLGNTDHILKAGIVCDRCNNYFASKVEEPLLSTPYFREQCSQAGILNKKGRPARVRGLHPQSRSVIEIIRNVDGTGLSIGTAFEKDEKRWVDSLLNQKSGRIYMPRPAAPDEALMSRFLAKLAIECLAFKMVDIEDGVAQITAEKALDPLRDYARRGPSKPQWPIHSRFLHRPDFTFRSPGLEPYEVLHEWTFTYLDHDELYFILGLFGVEFALNMAERETKSYQFWIESNSHRSPLYPNGIDAISQPD